MQLLYNLAIAFSFPLLLAAYIYRLTFGGKSARGLLERFGFLPRATRAALAKLRGKPLVWVHAVSVGEVAAAQPIVRALHELSPEANVVLSVTTPTGRAEAERRLPECHALFYLPLDLPSCVRRTIAAVQPDVLAILETELWPNLTAEVRRFGAPVILVNGRISDHAFSRARHFRSLYEWVFSNFREVGVQTELDAQRVQALGADPERVRILGNSKFDEPMPQVTAEEALHIRRELGFAPEDELIICGSTGPGEEEILLEAFGIVRRERPRAQLLIAPRQIERGEEIAQLARARGYTAALRSQGAVPPADGPRVFVLNTMGELPRVYSIASVAFVGRSLVPLGGGNILQPLAFGKPVLFGPHMENFRDYARLALDAGVGFQVSRAEELAQTVSRLLSAPDERQAIAQRAARLLEANRGASRAYAQMIVHALEDRRPCARTNEQSSSAG